MSESPHRLRSNNHAYTCHTNRRHVTDMCVKVVREDILSTLAFYNTHNATMPTRGNKDLMLFSLKNTSCQNYLPVTAIDSKESVHQPTSKGEPCCRCCRPHSTNVLPAESSTLNHVAANSLPPPGGKERLHFVGIRPEVQARKGGW